MKNFRTYNLAMDFYRECQKIKPRPQHLRDQFERASLSIVLNLAEGSGKPTKKDRSKFYSISLGSLREVQAILDILNYQSLLTKSDPVAAHLYRLIQNPGGCS